MSDNQNEEVILQEGTDFVQKMQDYSDEEIIQTFIVKAKNSRQDEPSGSKQILSDDEFQGLYDSAVAIEPLYNPLLWATLMEKNTRLAKLIRTYARNTVGLGWGIYSKKPITKDTTQEEKNQIEREKELLESLFEYPNKDLPFMEVMYQVKVDEEATGNGFLEVSRNLKGIIDGLYHIPSHTMRILRGQKGFVQIRAGKFRYFKNFNEESEINAETGVIKEGKNSIPYVQRGNEIIHFKIYTPRDSFYGIPRYVASADSIAGTKMAARRNLAFFRNDATPRLAIVVQNGKLDGKSIDQIEKFVNVSGKGPENAHRAMVLQAQPKQQGGYQERDVKIDVVPLTVGQTDDASHIKYRTANDEELREAFGIAEVFLGAKGSVNRATAMVSRAITNEQEFIPDAKTKEYKINSTICRSFGVKMVKLEFDRPNSLDEMDKAEMFAKYLQGGGITPNDIRHELGKDEYTEEWGDKPIQIGLVEYQMGVLAAQGTVAENGSVDNKDEVNNNDDGSKKSDSKDDRKGNGGKNQSSNDANGDNKAEKATRILAEAIQKMIDNNMPRLTIDLDEGKIIE